MRESTYSIFEKRKKRQNVILVTGATGFVGSHIAVELLKKRHPIILLCRSNDKLSAHQRIRQVLRWLDFSDNANIKVIDSNFTEPRLGLDDKAYAYLLENVDEIFHCAAETSFSEEKRDLLEKANVSGTLNVLKLATEGKCYFFHHVSTAYIAGKRHGICKEEYLPQTQFYNPYEETKHKAEGLVLEICNREGIRSNIYRPSIIYGDSKSGKSSKFDTFYFAIKLINSLKAIYEKDIIENGGLNAEKLGIKKDDDGRLFLPLRIEDVENSSVNDVPIDFVVNGCLAIMENCLDGDIFHLVNRNPKTLDELIVFVERLLNVRGIKPIATEEFNSLPQNSLEKMLDPFINIYRPYLCDDRIFDDKKSAKILQKNNIICPNLNYEIASKCFQYAMEVDWGNRMFDSADTFDDPPSDWFINKA